MLRSTFLCLIFLYLCLLLSKCSPINRHARLVEKYPFVHTQDTIIKVDTMTFFVEKNEVDTAFFVDTFLIKLTDTIQVEKERLKIKLYAVHDSIFIDGECDTIRIEKIIERKIPIVHYKEKETKFTLKKYLIILLVLLSLILIGNIFRK